MPPGTKPRHYSEDESPRPPGRRQKVVKLPNRNASPDIPLHPMAIGAPGVKSREVEDPAEGDNEGDTEPSEDEDSDERGLGLEDDELLMRR